MTLSKKPERDCDSMEVRLYNRGWNAAIDAITSPPAQRKPLTDEELEDLYFDKFSMGELKAFARAIEAKLRSKNEDRN